MTANVGVTERADRLVAILVATGLDGLGVPYVQALALWGLAVGSTVTIVQRALAVRRQALAETPAS
jgi:CDP-diacylglycerol--glycerol-3-phosphate 3-phosphatidyltransferase